MSDNFEVNDANVIDLVKKFKQAVDKCVIEMLPATISEEEAKEQLKMVEDMEKIADINLPEDEKMTILKLVDMSKQIGLINVATVDELELLSKEKMAPAMGLTFTANDYIQVAEIYTRLAERANAKGWTKLSLTDEFKACIPEEAKTEAFINYAQKSAPTFVKYCS